MLTYNRETDFEDCEKLILSCATVREDANRLKLATLLRLRAHPSGSASFAQALITWARTHDPSTLVTYAQADGNKTTLENLARRLYGFVGMMMATDIVAVDGIKSVRPIAYSEARNYALAMNKSQFSDTAKGVSVNLVCVDHSTLGYLSPFYHGQELNYQMKSERDFLDLTSKILDFSIPESSRRRFRLQDSNDIGGILRELFANTHDHSRTDIDGRPWRKSVRGIHTAHHMIRVDRIAESSKGLPSLRRYLEAHGEGVQDENIQFLELSVFDSGPGFAARMLRAKIDENVSLEREYEAVNKCFIKHVSSKPRKTDGLGLFRTLGLLKANGGFLRLRTGRLSLYKAFDPNPSRTISELNDDDVLMRDAITGSDSLTLRAAAEGALVSIFMPVGGVQR